ncbi:hypothetical protein B4Q13_22260 [Lacticaseibacillus rhamnosus]
MRDGAAKDVKLFAAQALTGILVDAACEHGARLQRDRNEGQAQLFGGFDEDVTQTGRARMPLPDAPAWSESEQLSFEKETLGLYWSGHPVDRYREELREFGARSTLITFILHCGVVGSLGQTRLSFLLTHTGE